MFVNGLVYRRRDLHRLYGGQQQGGISTPSKHPFLLLFTGESGEQYGYRDGWDRAGTFRYTGEGQVGDMQFVRGNLAIRDHAVNGKDLHLFQYEPGVRGLVRYLGQMVCAGYDLVPNVPDRHGHARTAIVFRLVPVQRIDADGSGKAAEQPADATGVEVPSG